MKARRICVTVAATLWRLASCQAVSATPSDEDYLSRRGHSLAILNDHLYIDGGLFSQRVNGTIARHDGDERWQLNDTLSLPLKESWDNATVQLKVTPKGAPVFSNAALWVSESNDSFYMWGGWAAPGTLTKFKELWQFTADAAGGGVWRAVNAANPAFLLGLVRSNAASVATCRGKGLYLGGYVNRNTDDDSDSSSFIPTPGLVVYDMQERTWANVSADGFNEYGTSVYGAAACADTFGTGGLFVPIGGDVTDRKEFKDDGRSLIDMTVIRFYDVAAGTWHAQPTSGDPPPVRDRHCVAGVAGPDGTFEIYVYGGHDRRDEEVKSDLYILSLPGFVWIRADTALGPRASHACAVAAGNRQMVVVGGYGANRSYEDADPWAQGLAVFDLPSLSWKDRYDGDAGPYEPPAVVQDWYRNGGLDSVNWTDNDVKSLFITDDNQGNAVGSSNGAIIGGVVGGVMGIGLLGVTAWFFKRRRKGYSSAQPGTVSSSGDPDVTPGHEGNYDAAPAAYSNHPVEMHDAPRVSEMYVAPKASEIHQPPIAVTPHEMSAGTNYQELDGRSRPQPAELNASPMPHEIPSR